MKQPYFDLIKNEMIKVWPDHERVINKSLSQRDDELLIFTEKISEMIYNLISEDIVQYCESYKWTCQMLTQEEIYFRREGKYRFSKLSEVQSSVYDDSEFMSKYVRGLLLTQVMWTNHINTMFCYDKFLEKNKIGSILEIGPGHGLLIAIAGLKGITDITAWDISEASLEETKKNLKTILPNLKVNYVKMDALNEIKMKSFDKKYDAIVLSEVLEHIEDPGKMLLNTKEVMNSNANLFINIPINCPAPDHICFFDSVGSVEKLIIDAGLKISELSQYPLTGYNLEIAMKRALAVSICLTAKN